MSDREKRRTEIKKTVNPLYAKIKNDSTYLFSGRADKETMCRALNSHARSIEALLDYTIELESLVDTLSERLEIVEKMINDDVSDDNEKSNIGIIHNYRKEVEQAEKEAEQRYYCGMCDGVGYIDLGARKIACKFCNGTGIRSEFKNVSFYDFKRAYFKEKGIVIYEYDDTIK